MKLFIRSVFLALFVTLPKMASSVTPLNSSDDFEPQIAPGDMAIGPLVQQADSEIKVRRLKSLLDCDQLDGDAFLARVEAVRRRIEGSRSD